MRVGLGAIRRGERDLAEETAALTPADLRAMTDEIVDTQLRLIDGITDDDVLFLPVDPAAADPGATGDEASEAWTLGHVVVHTTAGSEEGAAAALTLARGAPLDGRPRYETPWQEMRTAAQVRHRLEESRRMRLAMLAAWPDAPHLDQTVVVVERYGPMNAVARFVFGLVHEDWHLPQVAEIVRQAKAARGEASS